jgi:rhodanese-related sulfurtransferase
MTLDQLNGQKEKLKKIKNRPIIIICDTGNDSSKAVNTLRASGQENVYGISGGIAGWTEANMPLITKKKK